MKPVGRRVGGDAGEQADGQVEGTPPGVDRRGPAAVGRAVGGQHQGRLGGGGEVRADLGRVVGGVLGVLVEREGPGDFLGFGVDLHRAAEAAGGGQEFLGDVADRAIGGERDAAGPAVGVLHYRLVPVQVERGDQGAGAVRGRQRGGFPAPRGQPERGVLELGLGRGQPDGQLAEHLGMRVQGVAGCLPVLIRARRPARGHGSSLSRPPPPGPAGRPGRRPRCGSARRAWPARRTHGGPRSWPR